MSPRWMLGAAAIMIGSVVIGTELGNFAAGQGLVRTASANEASASIESAPIGSEDASLPDLVDRSADYVPVICKGCGPTLAQRRITQDDAPPGISGYGTGDAEARRYLQDLDAEDPHQNRPEENRPDDGAPPFDSISRQ